MFIQHAVFYYACAFNSIIIYIAARYYSIPGRYESFWKEVDHVKNILKNRQELKVENAGIAALFGLECLAWFYGGEIVGRGFTFTGYRV